MAYLESITQGQKLRVYSVHNSITVHNKVIISCGPGRRRTRVDLRGKEQVSESLSVVGESKPRSGAGLRRARIGSVGRLTSGTS